jgi:hypothetical protein
VNFIKSIWILIPLCCGYISQAQDTISFILKQGIILIRVQVNKIESHLIVDCGSSYSYLNSAIAGKFDFQIIEQDQSFIIGFGGVRAKIYQAKNASIKFINITMSRGWNKATDLALFSKQLQVEIIGIMGSDMLFFLESTLDFKSKRLILNF